MNLLFNSKLCRFMSSVIIAVSLTLLPQATTSILFQLLFRLVLSKPSFELVVFQAEGGVIVHAAYAHVVLAA